MDKNKLNVLRTIGWQHLAIVSDMFESMDISTSVFDLVRLKDAWLRAHASDDVKLLESIYDVRIANIVFQCGQVSNLTKLLEILWAISESTYISELTDVAHHLVHTLDIPYWVRPILNDILSAEKGE
jgi:hypothetical protein